MATAAPRDRLARRLVARPCSRQGRQPGWRRTSALPGSVRQSGLALSLVVQSDASPRAIRTSAPTRGAACRRLAHPGPSKRTSSVYRGSCIFVGAGTAEPGADAFGDAALVRVRGTPPPRGTRPRCGLSFLRLLEIPEVRSAWDDPQLGGRDSSRELARQGNVGAVLGSAEHECRHRYLAQAWTQIETRMLEESVSGLERRTSVKISHRRDLTAHFGEPEYARFVIEHSAITGRMSCKPADCRPQSSVALVEI